MKDLIRLTDLQSSEVYEIFNLADEISTYRFAGNYLPILYKNCRLSSLHPKKKEQIKRRDFCTLLAPFLDV